MEVLVDIKISLACCAVEMMHQGSAFGHWTIGQPSSASDKIASARLSVGQLGDFFFLIFRKKLRFEGKII
jgi:hypothetical protein